MNEPDTFELCAQLMMAESLAAEKRIQARMAQEFFQAMLGLHLDVERSYTAWRAIAARWDEARSQKDLTRSFRQVLLSYLLDSGDLNDPIITDFKEFQRLRLSSTTDYLTGMNNRRFFDAALAQEVHRASRYGENLSLVLVDLNRFKEVNDTHGHEFGDRLLVLAGKTLQAMLRLSDSAYRVGGDEFALLLPQANYDGAATLAERLRQRFAEEIGAISELRVPVSLAYGVANCPREGTEAKTLFALADKRLYEFKRSIGSPRSVPRKYKRIPTEGLGATVSLRVENVVHEARVVDFSFGGLGLSLAEEVYLPDFFAGYLHLPVLPTASVSLRKLYVRPEKGGGIRVGCAFHESLPPPSPAVE